MERFEGYGFKGKHGWGLSSFGLSISLTTSPVFTVLDGQQLTDDPREAFYNDPANYTGQAGEVFTIERAITVNGNVLTSAAGARDYLDEYEVSHVVTGDLGSTGTFTYSGTVQHVAPALLVAGSEVLDITQGQAASILSPSNFFGPAVASDEFNTGDFDFTLSPATAGVTLASNGAVQLDPAALDLQSNTLLSWTIQDRQQLDGYADLRPATKTIDLSVVANAITSNIDPIVFVANVFEGDTFPEIVVNHSTLLTLANYPGTVGTDIINYRGRADGAPVEGNLHIASVGEELRVFYDIHDVAVPPGSGPAKVTFSTPTPVTVQAEMTFGAVSGSTIPVTINPNVPDARVLRTGISIDAGDQIITGNTALEYKSQPINLVAPVITAITADQPLTFNAPLWTVPDGRTLAVTYQVRTLTGSVLGNENYALSAAEISAGFDLVSIASDGVAAAQEVVVRQEATAYTSPRIANNGSTRIETVNNYAAPTRLLFAFRGDILSANGVLIFTGGSVLRITVFSSGSTVFLVEDGANAVMINYATPNGAVGFGQTTFIGMEIDMAAPSARLIAGTHTIDLPASFATGFASPLQSKTVSFFGSLADTQYMDLVLEQMVMQVDGTTTLAELQALEDWRTVPGEVVFGGAHNAASFNADPPANYGTAILSRDGNPAFTDEA